MGRIRRATAEAEGGGRAAGASGGPGLPCGGRRGVLGTLRNCGFEVVGSRGLAEPGRG